MKESQLQTKIKQSFKDNAWLFNVHGGGTMQMAGVPDLCVVCNGRTFWLELKVGHNKLRLNQKLQMQRIIKNGGHAFVLREDNGHFTLENPNEVPLTFTKNLEDMLNVLRRGQIGNIYIM